jgi:hypothetical protein
MADHKLMPFSPLISSLLCSSTHTIVGADATATAGSKACHLRLIWLCGVRHWLSSPNWGARLSKKQALPGAVDEEDDGEWISWDWRGEEQQQKGVSGIGA